MSDFEQLQNIIASTLKIAAASVTRDSAMDDIEEWDSLGHVHIMVALEEAFDLYLDVDDFGQLTSVPAIMAYIAAEKDGA
ncbi:MAG: acyl carrier protein [Halioglobus sp.]|nr:acyl carrier protein [Halioglobus sp.]